MDSNEIWRDSTAIYQLGDLPGLHAVIRSCRRCEVGGYLERAAPVAFRPTSLPLMLCGQAPGIGGLVNDVPFGTPGSNRRLVGWFREAGLEPAEQWRDFMYITSITKCYPGRLPGAAGDRVPSLAEQALCRPYLEAQLRLVQPRIVIMVGLLAINTFLQPLGLKKSQISLDKVVGQGFTDEAGRRYLPLPHPSGVSHWLNGAANRAKVSAGLALLRQWRAELNNLGESKMERVKGDQTKTQPPQPIPAKGGISRYLEPGERVLWQGQSPATGRSTHVGYWLIVGICLLLAASFIAIGMIDMLSTPPLGWHTNVRGTGLIVVLVSLLLILLAGHAGSMTLLATVSRTHYCLTSRRMIAAGIVGKSKYEIDLISIWRQLTKYVCTSGKAVAALSH